MLAGEDWRQWSNQGEATNQEVLVRPTETHEAALAPQYAELHVFLTRAGTKMARSAASAYGPKRDCENELSGIRAPRTRL